MAAGMNVTTPAGRGSVRWLAGACVVVAAMAWSASPAGAYVYSSHAALNNAPTSAISRVNLDGSSPNPTFINAAGAVPGGVAVDAAHIYWTNADSHTIGRANLDGTGVEQNFITGVSFPSVGASLLAVDGEHIYWASLTVNPDNSANQTIGRANLDGSAPNASFVTAPAGVNGVAVDAGHVYWTANRTDFNLVTSGRIGRANLDGSSPNESFITLVGTAYGVAADGGHVYWTSLAGSGTGAIGRANADGNGVAESFISGAWNPFAIALDGAHIYWTNDNVPGIGPRIGRANLDGTAPDQAAVDPGPGGRAYGIAVDALSSAAASPGPSSLPVPRFARGVNAEVVSGTVRIRLPGKRGFAPLGSASQLPFGTIVDARRGRVRITAAADAAGHLQVGEFYEGEFRLRQVRRPKSIVELELFGSSFAGCGSAQRSTARARGAIAARVSKRRIRHLWGDAKGRWRTTGRVSSATVRGTMWRVEDRCDATVTRVKRGVVSVRDNARKRTVTVRAGHSYVAFRRR
jgi:hypothetical protein